MGMKFVFRTDASSRIGSGHLMRCLSLAEALRSAGGEVVFASRQHEGNLNALIPDRGFMVYELPVSESKESEGLYAEWLGSSQVDDAEQMIPILQKERPDWLIVDHYALDDKWEVRLRRFCAKIMAIDDLAERGHACDLLLDQNYEDPTRYARYVPETVRLLLGPNYALLKPEYSAYRDSMPPRTGDVQRVFIFFGGTDVQDMTGFALKALSEGEYMYLQVDVVVGSNYSHLEKLNKLAVRRGNTEIHSARPHLADLMARADLAIGAGGVTSWERICIGLPSIVIAVAENQVPISKILEAKEAIRFLGRIEDVTLDSLKQALASETRKETAVKRSRIAMSLCDGRGLSRVVDTLLCQTN